MSASKGSTKSSGHTEPDADTNDDGCNDTEQDKEEYTQTKGQTKVNCGQQRIVAINTVKLFLITYKFLLTQQGNMLLTLCS